MNTNAAGAPVPLSPPPPDSEVPAPIVFQLHLVVLSVVAVVLLPVGGPPLLIIGCVTLVLAGVLNLFIGAYRRPMTPAIALLCTHGLFLALSALLDGRYGFDLVILVPGLIGLILWPDNPVPVFALILYEWVGTALNVWALLSVPPDQEMVRQALIATIIVRLAAFWLLTMGLHTIMERKKFDPTFRPYRQPMRTRLILLAVSGGGVLVAVGVFATVNFSALRMAYCRYRTVALIDRTPYAQWLKEDAKNLMDEAVDYSRDGRLSADDKQRVYAIPKRLASHAGQPIDRHRQAEFAELLVGVDQAIGYEPERKRTLKHGRTLRTLAASRDESANAFSERWDDNGQIRTVTVRRRHLIVAHAGQVDDCAFSSDGRSLHSCGMDGRLCEWDTATGDPLRAEDDVARFGTVACSPDGRWVAVGNHQGRLRVYQAAPWKQVLDATAAEGLLTAITFTPDGNYLITADGRPGFVRWWDTGTWTNSRERAPAVLDEVSSATVSPDGELLALGGSRFGTSRMPGVIEWWDLPRCEMTVFDQKPAESSARDLQFSPDGQLLVSRYDRRIRLWERDGAHIIGELEAYHGPVAVSRDGKLLVATASRVDGVRGPWTVLVSVPSLKPVVRFQPHSQSPHCAAFSPTEDVVATAGSDGIVNLWEIQ